MSKTPTAWIMIQILIRRQEHSDSRYYSHDCYEDTEIIQADSEEELLAICYGIRKKFKNPDDISAYGSGDFVKFVGPFEVPANEFTVDANGNTEYWLDAYPMLDEYKVRNAIDTGATLYELTK